MGIILGIILIFLFIGVAEVAFQQIGFTRLEFALILMCTLLGSYINIPVTKVRTTLPSIDVEEVKVFWVTYRIPKFTIEEVYTQVAVNVGGAIIPVFVSVYLILKHLTLAPYFILPTLFTAVFIHMVARKVKGVGIVTPALLPPVTAALFSYLFAPSAPAVAAYISGTIGSLVGADLTNLKGIGEIGASAISIGGAGKFDGIFLTGVMAVILVSLL